MAHFAKLNNDNYVLQVVVVDNSILLNEEGVEEEQLGIDFLNETLGQATWKKTSYNDTDRNQYAGVGYLYDATRNSFIAPPPYSNFVLNNETLIWEAPTPMPENQHCEWDEENAQWINCVDL